MILTIIILSLLLASSAVVMLIQFLKLRKFNKDPFNSANKRLGIIRQKWLRDVDWSSSGYEDVIIEVESIKYNSGLSRIKVIKVTGSSAVYKKKQEKYYLEKLPEFIKTSEITFIDEVEFESEPFKI